ncbi:MAG: sporulation protein YqfC [Firmicutes bacterium]|nr:sporulation protein YqfC [Bacillota bacterium]
MAKIRRGRLLQSLASVLELPEDVILDLTRITITGNVQLLMENHRGISVYDPERICIRTQQGETVITGTGLKVDSLFASEILITGKIDGIQFIRSRG